jgi:uncharacterized membrane protein YfcA
MNLSLYEFAFALPLGVLFSAVGTVVGLGGGIFMMPLLVLAFGVPLKTAIAVSTFAIVPACLLSTALNAYRGHIDYFAGIALEIPAVAGAIVGTLLITHVPVRPLEYVFASVVAVLAFQLLGARDALADAGWLDRLNRIPPLMEHGSGSRVCRVGLPGLATIGLLAGIFAGFFGMGGGVFKTPTLVRIFQLPARIAAATALFTIVFTSLVASASHWQQGRLDWNLALPLAGAFLVGSMVGNRFSQLLHGETVERLLGVMLAVLAVAVGAHATFGAT